MKHVYLMFLCLSSMGFSQIPATYYDSAAGLSGFALKTELHNIISNGHIDQGYSSLFTGYIATHSDNTVVTGFENDNSILLYYTENPNGADPYTYTHESTNQCGSFTAEGDCYNHESLVPQSAFGSGFPMKNDIHHITPSDGFINDKRGDLPFGIVGTANWTSLNGSKRGNSVVPGYTGSVFEPIDEFKGDIARAILYFVTRYENTVDGYTSFPMFNGTKNKALSSWAISMLLDWHNNIDPVDQRDIDRNNASYIYQGNANPFIDHPEYANMIWIDTVPPTDPTNLTTSNPTDNSIDLSWTASTDDSSVVYDVYINSVIAYSTANITSTVNGLSADTTYCFSISARDTANNLSGFSNTSCESTTNNGSGSTNCQTENFENIGTASTSYATINWYGKEGGLWNATDARTDQSISTKAITIRNGSIALPTTLGGIGDFTITTKSMSGASGTFNLSVNGTIIGTIPYDGNEQIITIPNIDIENNVAIVINGNTNPNNSVVFDDLSYTCYSTLSVDTYGLNNIKLYPNPATNDVTISLKSDADTHIEIYDILGKRVFNCTINKTQKIDLQNLKTGIYMVKIVQNKISVIKKFIKN